MGCRMINEFLARAPHIKSCKDFKTSIDVLAKQAFLMFLGVTAEHKLWDCEEKSCSLILKDNPLADFVMLPSCYASTLWYSNVLCGLIRGALEMVNVRVNAYFVKDMLKGD